MKSRMSLLLMLFLTLSFAIQAQDFDDIYYNSSKAKKAEKEQAAKKETVNKTATATYRDMENGRNVDEYNRRGSYNETDTISNDSLTTAEGQDFVYTDRIRRFYNPSVVVESNNPEIAESYYIATAPNVNIILGTPTWTPYYSWNWGWSTWGYDYWSWSPYYGWSTVYHSPWCYDWGWSFGWTWHHHHHAPHHWWGHGHGHHGPIYGSPVHKPSIPKANYNTGGGRRPFGAINNGSGRPGNMSNGGRRPVAVDSRGNRIDNNRNNGTVSNNKGRRPSTVSSHSTGTQTSNNYGSRPSSTRKVNVSNGNTNRRRANVGTNSSSRNNSSPSYKTSTSNNRSNRSNGSYRSSSSRSSGSFSGGSNRSSNVGGGNRRR